MKREKEKGIRTVFNRATQKKINKSPLLRDFQMMKYIFN